MILYTLGRELKTEVLRVEYQPGMDECFCYKCGRRIYEGEEKLRVNLFMEKVITGESDHELIKWAQLPSVCISCAQPILRETEIEMNVFIFPKMGEPTLFSN